MNTIAPYRDPTLGSALRRFNVFRLLATSYLYVPIFMLLQESRGLSFFARLGLGGLYSAVVIIVEIPTGVFADRMGRRRSMMLGAAVMIASSLIGYRAHSVAGFALAESLAALSMALCSGADSAYLYDLLQSSGAAHEYSRRESVSSAWHLFGCSIAFAVGGWLATYDLSLPYLATAIVAAVALLIGMTLRDDRPPRSASPRSSTPSLARSYLRDARGALREVANNPRLGWLVGYSAVVFVLLLATVYLYQPYLTSRGWGPAAIGAQFAVVYLVAAVIAYFTYVIRAHVRDNVLLWGLLATLAASFALLEAVRGPWVIALLLVQAVANGLYAPLTKPLLNAEIPHSRQRAAVLSVESMVRRAAMGVFAPLAGLFGETRVLPVCAAVGGIGLVLLVAAQLRQSRSLVAVSAPTLVAEPASGQIR